jgi:hypothetical protein
MGRWLTRDPIGYAGGENLYEYCGGNPVGKIDPSGLEDHDALWVQREIAKWKLDTLEQARINHMGYDQDKNGKCIQGKYDYKNTMSDDRFQVHGIWMNAPQFGQYSAGYAGYYSGSSFGLWGVQTGGHFYEFLEDGIRSDREVGILGDDGVIDKKLIMLGAVDALMDRRKGGYSSPCRFTWQGHPGATKQDALQYLKDYNKRNFGSINASPHKMIINDNGTSQRNNIVGSGRTRRL